MYIINALYSGDSYRRTLTNSEDPGKMPHNAAFHQGIHSLIRQNGPSQKEIQYYPGITCDPLIYIRVT